MTGWKGSTAAWSAQAFDSSALARHTQRAQALYSSDAPTKKGHLAVAFLLTLAETVSAMSPM